MKTYFILMLLAILGIAMTGELVALSIIEKQQKEVDTLKKELYECNRQRR